MHSIQICTSKYRYVVCVGMYKYIHLQLNISMYMYVHVCTCICKYVNVFTCMYIYVRYVNVCTGMSPVTHPLRGSTLILLGLSPYVARVAISVPLLVSTIRELLTSSTK